MSQRFHWLHLTDLHFGLDQHGWLWPQLRQDFRDDVRSFAEKWGGFDAVFFTGDLTQAGSPEQFKQLEDELVALWPDLSLSTKSPLLFPVPGNHDLVRPHELDPVVRALNSWESDEKLRKAFWSESHSEYRDKVSTWFKPYTDWWSTTKLPKPNMQTGILPGDASTVLTVGSLSIGVIGLNSAFLQNGKGNFSEKLDLHVSQLNAVCMGDPDRWIERNSVNFLLTHHSSDWLIPHALEHFRGHIYTPGRFLVHLCGHLHAPSAIDSSEGGGVSRRVRIGHSLFGLEKWDGLDPAERIYGYTVGELVIDGASAIERYWPRVAIKGQHGAYRLKPDHSFDLNDDDSAVFAFEVRDKSRAEQHVSTEERPKSVNIVSLLEESKPDLAVLATMPKFISTVTPQHQAIRLEEQSQFEADLRKSRTAWVVADWGVGKDGFLAVGFARFKEEPQGVFHLICDECTTVEKLQTAFKQQFSLTVQEFVHHVSGGTPATLLLDAIPTSLCSGVLLVELQRLRDAILDFCPLMRVVITSRSRPSTGSFIELLPLDPPDVRAYVMKHVDSLPEIGEADVIDRMYARSDGLPMHIDRMLKGLRVASLDEVLRNEQERSEVTLAGEATPKALMDAVAQFVTSHDKTTKRSLRLLKVLTVLPFGETLDRLGHYIPAEPFFPGNAVQLVDAALLEIVPLTQSTTRVRGVVESDAASAKLLRVPRPVRDYVNSILTPRERAFLVTSGAECLLGADWREGVLKLRPTPPGYRDITNGVGNEFAIVAALLAEAKSVGFGSESQDRIRLLKVGLALANKLNSDDRYLDTIAVTEMLLGACELDTAGEVWFSISALQGDCLRMVGRHAEAVKCLKEALPSSSATRSVKARRWLQLALAYDSLENNTEAIDAAGHAKELSEGAESAVYLQATAIEVKLSLVGQERKRRLTALENEARDNNNLITALNINLGLASEEPDPDEKLRILERMPLLLEQGYSLSRAIAARVPAIHAATKRRKLRPEELDALYRSYSYLYSQRFSPLFDACHDSLWKEFEAKDDAPGLAKLFRFSSFVWRIRGDETRETLYARKLHTLELPRAPQVGTAWDKLSAELSYFWRRVRAIVL